MGDFTGHDVHIDTPLSNVAIAYEPSGFIGADIAPIVPVNKQSDGFYIWSIADTYRLSTDDRAPGTEANRITRAVSSATYYAKNYALKDRIPYEDIKNEDANGLFLSRENRARFIKSKLYLNWEKRVANIINSLSNVSSYTTPVSLWSEHRSAYSDPVGDIMSAIRVVDDLTGYKPNSIVFGFKAWTHFRNHGDVIGRIFGETRPGSGARVVGPNDAAALFEVDRVLVGRTVYNSTQEAQTQTMVRMIDDKVLVYFAPMQPSIVEPSFMYSFRWKAVADLEMQAEVRQIPAAKAEEVELGYYQDEKITGSTLGFIVTSVSA